MGSSGGARLGMRKERRYVIDIVWINWITDFAYEVTGLMEMLDVLYIYIYIHKAPRTILTRIPFLRRGLLTKAQR